MLSKEFCKKCRLARLKDYHTADTEHPSVTFERDWEEWGCVWCHKLLLSLDKKSLPPTVCTYQLEQLLYNEKINDGK